MRCPNWLCGVIRLVKGCNEMSARDFWQKSRWGIISGISFLVLFALVAGVLSYGLDVKINHLNEQLAQISESVASLENASPEMKDSIDGAMEKIDGISQKIDFSTADSSAEDALKTKLNDVLGDLSDLSRKVEDLKNSVEAQIKAAKEAAKEARTAAAIVPIPDAPIAGDAPDTASMPEPGEEDNPEQEADDKNTGTQMLEAGEVFTVTVQANAVSDLYGYQFNLGYENGKASYDGALKSSVNGINTIFKKDMPDHLLVGGTMIGDMVGYSGEDVEICSMRFVAAERIDPASFTIDGVSTVDSNQKYVEDITGWKIILRTSDQEPDMAE